MRINWLILTFIALTASCTRDISSETEESQEADAAVSIPIKYEANCLAYLTADKSFHDQWTRPKNVIQREIFAAIETRDEAALRILEDREQGRWKNFIARSQELDAIPRPVRTDDPSREIYDSAVAARQAAIEEASGYDSFVVRLIADYVEAYASSGHDVEGFDMDIIFKVAAHERQTHCPQLAMYGLMEPLEIIAD